MEDRVPTKPGRVLITPENGSPAYYATVAMADEPTQVGTALNKQNLLSDPVATLIGLTAAAVPDDMFDVLAHAGDLHVWRRTKSGVIDYPVSVNPNAYQTGSDAKPAGYTLGEIVSGEALVRQFYTNANYLYSDSVSVSDDGTVSLSSAQSFSYNIQVPGQDVSAFDVVKGKFFSVVGAPSPFSGVVFIPVDAQFSVSTGGVGDGLKVNQYQPVTGYPAIPAGTTIEYLGKLGDKSRMQIVSYIGTGTYGASNPCSITADFPIESATFLGRILAGQWYAEETNSGVVNAVSSVYQETYRQTLGFSSATGIETSMYGKISGDKKTISWYSTRGNTQQLNISGQTYYFLCQG